jgi:hypothetical protein
LAVVENCLLETPFKNDESLMEMRGCAPAVPPGGPSPLFITVRSRHRVQCQARQCVPAGRAPVAPRPGTGPAPARAGIRRRARRLRAAKTRAAGTLARALSKSRTLTPRRRVGRRPRRHKLLAVAAAQAASDSEW